MKIKLSIIFFLLSFSQLALSEQLPTFNLIKNTNWLKYAEKAKVEPEVLYAIALKESGKIINDKFIPYPWAIGIGVDSKVGQDKHISLYPKSKEEAKTILKQLLQTGHKNIGIGLMQISWIYHSEKVNTAFDLLDINTNLNVASKILKNCGKRNKTTKATLSCYSYGEGNDLNGLSYAKKTFVYSNKYGKDFVKRLMPTGPLVGELNEYLLAAIWSDIDKKAQNK